MGCEDRVSRKMDNPAFKEDEFRSFIVFNFDKSMTEYQKFGDFVANDNENQKKCIFTER